MTTLVNRADLLACLKQYDSSHLDDFAAILGYTATENSEKAKTFEIVGSSSITLTSTSTMSFTAAPSKIQASFLRVVAHRRFGEDEIVIDEPEWYRSAQSFKYNDATLKAPVGLTPPPQPPLMPWFRLWPFLKLALGAKVLSHKPDLPCVVDRLARGEMLRRLPKARRKGWASQAQLIIDYDESLLPFWSDFNDLRLRLADLRGQAGLNVLAFPAGDPGGTCWQDTPSGWREVERYRPPLAGTPVLILSDLGCNEASEQRRLRWRRFGEQLVRSACRAVALMPSPPRWWEDELTKLFISVYWDRAIRPPQRLARSTAYSTIRKVERDFSSAERLLTLLGTAVRVEPALLRAARYQFPAAEMDAGAEFAAWNHPAVHATHLAFYFQQAQVASYRSRFRDDAGLTPDQKQRIAELLQSHHAHLSPVITHEEQLAKAELLGEPCPQDAEEFAQRLAKTLSEARGEVAQLSKQWLRRMGVRQHASLWNNDALAAAWIKAQAEGDLTGMAMPEGLSLEKLAWTLPPRAVVARQIRQLGQELVFSDSVFVAPGSLVGEVRHSTSVVQVENLSEEGTQTLSLLYDIDQPILLTPNQPFRIRTDREELYLDWLTLPEWADIIGRDSFGLYASLNLNGIVQRFRWINPGTFLMGSPPDEPERLESEILHEVTLTQGFWLADSACNQALWMAVMGENPSRFQDSGDNPVDSVSWEDVQQFIVQLNGLLEGLNARLPTETEWEYACRAGTTTPFSFGENVTSEQVNYNGNYPYAGGTRSLYRKNTVPVKSLPPNPWGLYEMHGNVWEWCADWYGDYAPEASLNPPGSKQGSGRVLRGGSWFNFGGFVRSADRDWNKPSYRCDRTGFRLALGLEVTARQEQLPDKLATESVDKRIHNVLAGYGFGSRREIEDMIRQGRIDIRGKQAQLGDLYFPGDPIQIDGSLVVLSGDPELHTHVLLYHKASGEVVNNRDKEIQPTIFDHLPPLSSGRWISVGRMEANTQGLLLITTNGYLANGLMHALRLIQCEYAVRVRGVINDDKVTQLTKGVDLEDGLVRFETILLTKGEGANHWYRITVKNGRSGIVRRLLESQGITSNRLIRIRFANIELPKDLKAGSYLNLLPDQVDSLMKLVGL